MKDGFDDFVEFCAAENRERDARRGIHPSRDDAPDQDDENPFETHDPQDGKSQSGPCLSLADWMARDIPPPDRLLGDLLHTTTRMLLVAPTGLGKTNFAMALAFHMAAGIDFLHRKAIRPARVLFVDGEMSRRLLRIRLGDAMRRLGVQPANLFALSRDDLEDMPPLNTEHGQAFIDGIISRIGGIDFSTFDNVQALMTGDMKDEESWQQTLPWIKALTKRSIGQTWVHHTGHDKTRSYGTSTREWQLDTVALMESVERPDTDIAFNLKFTKARERSPENRADFQPVTITLARDQWAVETTEPQTVSGKRPSPQAQAFHKALLGALLTCGKIRPEAAGCNSCTFQEWENECASRGLIDPERKPDSKRALMSNNRLELVTLKWIVCRDKIVWNRTGSETVSP